MISTGERALRNKTESRDNRASSGTPVSLGEYSLDFLFTQGGGGSFGKAQDLGPVELNPYLISCYLYIMGKLQIYKQLQPPILSCPWGPSPRLCLYQPLGTSFQCVPLLAPSFTRILGTQHFHLHFREKGIEAQRGEVTSPASHS